MTLIALLSSILISSGSFVWALIGVGLGSFSGWIIVFGAFWLLCIWQRWYWYSSFALVLVTLSAAFALWLGFSPGWMFASGIFAVVAWDMTDFRQRLILMPKDDYTRAVERRHLARVSLLVLLGMLSASLVMWLQAEFTPAWKAYLVGLTLLGLTQLIAWYRK